MSDHGACRELPHDAHGHEEDVGVVEQAGLVTAEKVRRVRSCKLGLRGLEEEAAWIARYGQFWGARFNELDEVVEELKRKEKADGRKKKERARHE